MVDLVGCLTRDPLLSETMLTDSCFVPLTGWGRNRRWRFEYIWGENSLLKPRRSFLVFLLPLFQNIPLCKTFHGYAVRLVICLFPSLVWKVSEFERFLTDDSTGSTGDLFVVADWTCRNSYLGLVGYCWSPASHSQIIVNKLLHSCSNFLLGYIMWKQYSLWTPLDCSLVSTS